MPPTCSAPVMRRSCWGSAVTWPPCGLFWGFWPRSSSWSSSSSFMRSARSLRIYKTVSRRQGCFIIPLFLIYLRRNWFNCSFQTLSACCGATRQLWKEAHFVFFRLSHFLARDTNRVTWHCALPELSNSVWRGWPNRQTLLQEVAPCQDNFTHLIFMRKMILQCCGGGQFQLLTAFQGPCAVPKLLQASPRDTSFRDTTCVCQPGIF